MLRLIYEKNIYVDASIIFTPLMLILATEIRPTKLLLECSFFQMVGKLSMSIYFWHPVARAIIKTTEIEGTLVGLIFYIILTVLFSVVSNDFIEKPIKRLLLKMYRKG